MLESCHKHEWVMSHLWMSHVTHAIEACHACDWVTSHICLSHVPQVIESCPTWDWVMSRIWLSHVLREIESCHTCDIKSCHTYEWVMSHMWRSHVIYMNESVTHVIESCHACDWVTSHVCLSHVIPMTKSWHIWMSPATRINESCQTHDRVNVTLLWQPGPTYSRWLSRQSLHMCKALQHTTTNLQHHISRPTEIGDFPARVYICVTSQSVRRQDFKVVLYESVMSHVWISHDTHMIESCHTYTWVISLHMRHPSVTTCHYESCKNI